MIKKLQKVQTGDVVLERAQTLLKGWSDKVSDCPLLDGRLITTNNDGDPLILTSGVDYNLKHKLGRMIVGYIITQQTLNGSVRITHVDSEMMTLRSDATMNINLWVF